MQRSRIHAGLGALFAVCLTLALAAPAGAATKPFLLTISPGGPSVVQGGQLVTLTAKVTNETGTQQLGSADLAEPAGFQVTSASVLAPGAGSAKVSSSCTLTTPAGTQTEPCVTLRSLSLASGASVTVQMTVATPICVKPMSSFSWSIEAKQANNFSGQPGNDLTLDGNSTTTTTLDGACKLAFPPATQPHNVVIPQVITGTDWDPTGPPVSVEVQDKNGNLVSDSTASVTVALATNPGLATLGGTLTVVAAGGVATFKDLTVDQPAGGYSLGASSGALMPTGSSTFAAQTVEQNCAANASCTETISTPNGNDAQIFANAGPAGLLVGSANENAGAQLTCAGYTAVDPNTYDFISTVDRSKVVTITIKQPGVALHGSATQILRAMQICFGATYPFNTASGLPAASGILPDGTPGFIGLLPNCPAAGPCHDRKSDTTILDPTRKLGFDIVVVADIPSGLAGDPNMRG